MTRSENRNQLRTMRWSSSLVIAIVCFLVPLAAKAANSDAETQRIKDSGSRRTAFDTPGKIAIKRFSWKVLTGDLNE